MKLLSIQIGEPRHVLWQGKTVVTGIFKEPVSHPIMVLKHHLEGDGQADLSVHGGEFKAVYAYAAEHYAWWTQTLQRDLPYGSFGENLTVGGFDEERVFVGNRYCLGQAILEATQPRLPCYKLGIKFNDPRIIKTFMQSKRWGVYFRVIQEGQIAVGDTLELIFEHPARIPTADLYRFLENPQLDQATIQRVLGLENLAPNWRASYEERLA